MSGYPFRVLVLLAAAFTVTLIGISSTHAQTGDTTTGGTAGSATMYGPSATGSATGSANGDGDASSGNMLTYLKVIAENTTSIANDMTNYIDVLATAWTQPDQTGNTSTLITNLIGIGNLVNTELTAQVAQQTQLNQDLLGDKAKSLDNANDLVYSSLLGVPFFKKDPRGSNIDYSYNYIKNAAGMTVPHTAPNNSWQGADNDVDRYQNFYNTVMAIESYNGYILSGQYADKVDPKSETSSNLNTLQQSLISWINAAPSADSSGGSGGGSFLSQVAGEPIGLVLRQLLVVESQVFVLMTQMLQTQKQIATSQAMTNALLVLSNQQYESYLLSKAQGVRQQS